MKIVASFSVETIENGWVVRDLVAGRAVHVAYNFDIARQIERFMHDAVQRALTQARILDDAPADPELNIAKAP